MSRSVAVLQCPFFSHFDLGNTRFAAQEMLVLLGQFAHDLVIWTRNDLARVDRRFHKYGIERTVRDAMHIDGCIATDARAKSRTSC